MLLNLYSGKKRISAFLTLAIAIILITNSNVSAWHNHPLISKAGIELLPEWERAMLGDAADALVKNYCMYPDLHRSALNDGQKEKIALYKPYVQLPLLKDLSTWHKCNDDDSATCFYIVATSMNNAVKQLRLGNPSEAAKYMGPLLHFIEDNACPVHVVDNKLLAELFPVPEELKPFPLHRRVEEGTFPLEVSDYQVKLLGANVVDAATAFYPRFVQNRLSARRQAVPILKAVYAGNEQEADAGRTRAAEPAAKLIADVIHTICTITRDS